MYCTPQDVYDACSLTEEEVSAQAVTSFIRSAEQSADRETFTTYWIPLSFGVATSSTDATLTDSTQEWTPNIFTNRIIWVYKGTGEGQVRRIESNTGTQITVDEDWEVSLDTTSRYRVIYNASDAFVGDEPIDGNGQEYQYFDPYPIVAVHSLAINESIVSPAGYYLYKKIGKLHLRGNSPTRTFSRHHPQAVDIKYWYGVYPIPELVKRYTILMASLMTLASQMGGTFATPSTYSLPEGSVTVGQAYINIKSTFDTMLNELEILMKHIVRYPSVV